MNIGLAFDLKSDFAAAADGPDDRLEEYDSERTVDAIAAALAGLPAGLGVAAVPSDGVLVLIGDAVLASAS